MTSSFEATGGEFRSARFLFELVFLTYVVFPNPGEFNDLGIGPEGTRILLLDIFVILMVFLTIRSYRSALSELIDQIGIVPPLLFVGMFAFSLLRGLPTFGGFAIGEGRWYASIALVPAAYLIYDGKFGQTLKNLLCAVAFWHVVVILYRILADSPVDVNNEVIRYARGRESLVIGAACALLFVDLTKHRRRATQELPKIATLLLFVVILLVGQTRSILLFLPVSLVLSAILSGTVPFARILKGVLVSLPPLVVLWSGFTLCMPAQVTRSVETSIEVALESVTPETIGMLFSGEVTSDTRGDLGLSRSGNTSFRLMAWAQVLQTVDEASGGWWVGTPLGSGFFFYDASGAFYENLDPHNDYISILSKVGAIGLAAYFVILLSFLTSIRRAGKMHPALTGQTHLHVLLALTLLLMIFVGTSAEIRTYGTHFWMWALLGFGYKELHQLSLISSRKSPTILQAPVRGSAK